jgi:hypothetical protein
MRTSFNHQPEAQHPKHPAIRWAADYPIFRAQSRHPRRWSPSIFIWIVGSAPLRTPQAPCPSAHRILAGDFVGTQGANLIIY